MTDRGGEKLHARDKYPGMAGTEQTGAFGGKKRFVRGNLDMEIRISSQISQFATLQQTVARAHRRPTRRLPRPSMG